MPSEPSLRAFKVQDSFRRGSCRPRRLRRRLRRRALGRDLDHLPPLTPRAAGAQGPGWAAGRARCGHEFWGAGSRGAHQRGEGKAISVVLPEASPRTRMYSTAELGQRESPATFRSFPKLRGEEAWLKYTARQAGEDSFVHRRRPLRGFSSPLQLDTHVLWLYFISIPEDFIFLPFLQK